ncbi:MAG: hypothetical protein ACYS8K_06865 [Planctomycetota bacterium]
MGRLVALAFGLGLLCLAELVLHLAGYGGPTEMFLKVPEGDGTESYVTNPLAFEHTFAGNPIIRAKREYPAPPPQRFPAQKRGAYRVFVVGGSAAKGFPYGLNGSFPHFLEQILGAVCEGRRVEVINAGVTAISSYSVLERIEEVLGYGADMVVIYCGHNEFYGAYGAASAIPMGTHRPLTLCQLWLRRRRLTMALGDLVALLAPEPPPAQLEQKLVGIMPRRTDVCYGDEFYQKVRANYGANLRGIVAAARRRGAAVVLCTLGVNLRDFAPLGSLHAPDLSAEERRRWQEEMKAAEGLEGEAGALARRLTHLEAAAELSPGHARTRYLLARCLDEMSRHAEALGHYQAARNHDTLRWRAGADYEEVVRRVGAEAGAGQVVVAEVAAHLARNAEHGIPGGELFLEHVHATLKGYYLMAEAVARAIGEGPAAERIGPWHWERHLTFDQCLQRAGVDVFDRLTTLRKVLGMFQDGFSRQIPTEQEEEEFRRIATDLQEGMSALEKSAAAQARVVASERGTPYDWLHLFLAKEYAEAGRLQEALRELEKARRYGTWQIDNRRYATLFFTEAAIRLKGGDPEGSVRAARKALALDPGRPGPMRLLSEACAALGDPEAARLWAERARQAQSDAP